MTWCSSLRDAVICSISCLGDTGGGSAAEGDAGRDGETDAARNSSMASFSASSYSSRATSPGESPAAAAA